MILPAEGWALILSYLSYNDLIETSAVCKCFYHLPRKNSGFVKKAIDSRAVFSSVNPYGQYRDACLLFAEQISYGLRKKINENLFLQSKDVILNNLLFDILPFWVWKHLWYCSRSYYCSSMCLSCTRVCIDYGSASDYINNKLDVPIELFPRLLREGIVLMNKIYFFVHFHGVLGIKRINNFGMLYYESVSSPFFFYKTNLEILRRIVYNFVEKKILPLLISNGFSAYRNKTVCGLR